MPKYNPETGLKTCSKCRTSLPLSAYQRDSSRADGYNSQCRQCIKDTAQRRYNADVSQSRSYALQWYQDHRETVIKRNMVYATDHSELRHKIDALYRQGHPEVTKKNAHAYKARKLAAPNDNTVTLEALTVLLQSWGGTCPFCLQVAKPHIDHVVPLVSGGAHSMSNLQLMCKSCNSSKGTRTMLEWLLATHR